MTDPRAFVMSNLASGIFIDLTVDAGDDVLEVARAHLRQTNLSPEVQHGFFISVYPADAASHHPTDVPEHADAQRLPAATASPATNSPVDTPDERSPLDAAAAQGPLDWTESNKPANAAPGPDTPEVAHLSPLVAPPLGSAGGH